MFRTRNVAGPAQPERHPQPYLLCIFPARRFRSSYQPGSRSYLSLSLYLPFDDEGDDRSAALRCHPALRLRL